MVVGGRRDVVALEAVRDACVPLRVNFSETELLVLVLRYWSCALCFSRRARRDFVGRGEDEAPPS